MFQWASTFLHFIDLLFYLFCSNVKQKKMQLGRIEVITGVIDINITHVIVSSSL